jgi:hypothetical protein
MHTHDTVETGMVLPGFGKLKPLPVPVHTHDTLSRVYPYPCHALILGMPFLSSEQIVINTHEQMAIDKWSGFNLFNPPPQTPQPQGKQQVIPPLTPRKIQTPKPPTLRNSGTPVLAGCLLPRPIMSAV